MFLFFEGNVRFGFNLTMTKEVYIEEMEGEEEVTVSCPCCEGCGRMVDSDTELEYICPNCNGEGEFETYVYYTTPERWEEVELEDYVEVTTYKEGIGGLGLTDYFDEEDVKELEKRFLED